jgi:fructoselysine-6-phosphate deglycase
LLKFDDDEFRGQAASAVALRPQIEALVDELQAKELKNLFLVGSGGTYAIMLPYEHMVQRRSTLPVRAAIAPELVLAGDPTFGPGTLAVFASASGDTEDVIKAIEWAKQQGAHTLGFTGKGDSPFASAVDTALLSEAHGYDIQLTFLTTRILQGRGEFDAYDRLAAQLENIPSLLVDVAKQADPITQAFAESHKDKEYLFLVGAGNLWGFTYLYSMCVLEECQWLHTTRVHAAEFFHGSLELVEKETTVVVFVSEDESRPLTDRVISFARRYSDDVNVFDTKDYQLPGVDEEFRGLLSPLVMDTVSGRLNKHLEKERDHDLGLRRYYRVVEY